MSFPRIDGGAWIREGQGEERQGSGARRRQEEIHHRVTNLTGPSSDSQATNDPPPWPLRPTATRNRIICCGPVGEQKEKMIMVSPSLCHCNTHTAGRHRSYMLWCHTDVSNVVAPPATSLSCTISAGVNDIAGDSCCKASAPHWWWWERIRGQCVVHQQQHICALMKTDELHRIYVSYGSCQT